MTAGQLARILDRASVWLRHAQAVRRGRAAQRITNVVIGRTMARAMRKVWR